MKKPVTVKCPSCKVEAIEDFENCTTWNDPDLSRLSSQDIVNEYAKLQVYGSAVSVICTPCKSKKVSVIEPRRATVGMGQSGFSYDTKPGERLEEVGNRVVSGNFDAMPSTPGVSKSYTTERVEKVTHTVSESAYGGEYQAQPQSQPQGASPNTTPDLEPMPIKEGMTEGTIAWMIVIVVLGIGVIGAGGYLFMKHFGELLK